MFITLLTIALVEAGVPSMSRDAAISRARQISRLMRDQDEMDIRYAWNRARVTTWNQPRATIPQVDPDELAALLPVLRAAKKDLLAEQISLLLGVTGTQKHQRVLWQYGEPLDSRNLADRLLMAELPSLPCQPPSEGELRAMRATLGDFAVIRARGETLYAARPTAAELDDLAYLFVSVAQVPPEPGAEDVDILPYSAKSKEVWTAYRRAVDRHDPEAIAATSRAYLELLGFPGPVKLEAEVAPRLLMDGTSASGAMRHWAVAAELLGDWPMALALARRAPIDGGCNIGRDEQSELRLLLAIRAGERVGGCRAVVAERLQADEWGPPDEVYGAKRLSDAGWDLLRLYRGALLTANRDVGRRALEEALETAPPELHARERLDARGEEAWVKRTNALDGLVRILRKEALEPLLVTAETSIGDTRGDAIRLIKDELDDFKREEQLAVVRRLVPFLHSPDGPTRHAAVEAIGSLGLEEMRAELKPLLKDPYQWEDRDPKDPWRYPIRAATAEALKKKHRER